MKLMLLGLALGFVLGAMTVIVVACAKIGNEVE